MKVVGYNVYTYLWKFDYLCTLNTRNTNDFCYGLSIFKKTQGFLFPTNVLSHHSCNTEFSFERQLEGTLEPCFLYQTNLCDQGIGKDVPRAQRTPSWEIPNCKPYITGIYGSRFLSFHIELVVSTRLKLVIPKSIFPHSKEWIQNPSWNHPSSKTYQLHSTTTLLAGGNWKSLSIKELSFNQSIPHQLRWDNDPIHLSTSGWQQDMVWKLGLGCWCFKKTCQCEATLVVLQNFHSHVWLDANSSSKCCAPCDPLQLPTGVICEAS